MLYTVKLLVNYPDDKEVEAAVPLLVSRSEMLQIVQRLLDTEPEMTSFVMTVTTSSAQARAVG